MRKPIAILLITLLFAVTSGCRRGGILNQILDDDDANLLGQSCPDIGTEALPGLSPCDGITCDGHGTCQVQGDIGVCSCDSGYDEYGLHCWQPKSSPDSWTVLVYMSADNNLEEFGMDDLTEMMGVGSSDAVNIIVLSDRSTGYVEEDVGGVSDWSSGKMFRVEDGTLTEIDDLGELDMGDPGVLADFIESGISQYPADRYMIDFWNHGGAWYGFGWDEGNNNDELTLNELALGMSDGLSAAGVDHFDVVGFDACLMATLEVIETVAPFGHYLVASEELEPGHGWNYEAFQVLRDDPTIDGPALGKAIVDGFVEQAQAEQTESDITLSVVDMTGLNVLRGALYRGVETLSANITSYTQGIQDALRDAPAFGAMVDPRQSFHSVDFPSLTSGFDAEISAFASAYDTLEAAIDGMVLYNHAGTNLKGASGIAIYFPRQCIYYDDRYDDVEPMAVWRSFLKALWKEGTEGAYVPRFINDNGIADVAFEEDPWIRVAGTLDSATVSNLDYTGFMFSVEVDDLEIFMGEETASYDPDTYIVSHRWDTSALYIEQGDKNSYAYYQYAEGAAAGTFELVIPLAYYENGTDEDVTGWTDWQVVFDGDSGDVISETYYLYGSESDDSGGSEGVGELIPIEGSQFLPIIYVYDNSNPDDSGWYFFDVDPFDATQKIDIGLAYLPEDLSYYLYLTAEDIGGNTDAVYAYINNG